MFNRLITQVLFTVTLLSLTTLSYAQFSTQFSTTDLIKAASEGDLAKLNIALNSGIEPNAKNNRGETALLLASKNGNLSFVSALLGAYVDPDIADNYGNTPHFWATWYGHIEVARLLRDAGAKESWGMWFKRIFS